MRENLTAMIGSGARQRVARTRMSRGFRGHPSTRAGHSMLESERRAGQG
jgi:hypothetical protein